ncbi:MAG: Asp-tRNA(Asn)/Glu-tRNA(Gln) amidotransferase subunit GatC [Candidatus Pacebacteria bacterium]|nr:Asp-tRNA(Asn)/Glu-tRNA(Gln) amidotransferase subunit GatC [Candidatus Paceibacterota bacterium]
MITRTDIEKLASLARIRLSEKEKSLFPEEINSVLGYVEQIKNADASNAKALQKETVYNVMREDINPDESGVHTKDIVDEFPKKEGNYLKVKNIL